MRDDNDLLDLIGRAALEELTAEQCASIRAAAAMSPEIRQACLERIGLEEQLAATLGRPRVSVDELLAGRRRIAESPLAGRWLAPVVLALLLAGVAAAIVLRPRGSREEEVAVATPDAAVGEAPDVENAEPPAAAGAAADLAMEKGPADEAPADDAPGPPEASAATATTGDAGPPAAAEKPITPPAAALPWSAALAPDAPEPAPDVLFRPLPLRQGIDRTSLETWFAPLPGATPKFEATPVAKETQMTTMTGRFRLVPPLCEGVALRVLVHNPNALRIVAWSGNSAAVIEAEVPAESWRWCGSVLSRPAADKPAAARWLASTSDARGHRSGAGWSNSVPFTGILELRYTEGLLVLSRGEVRLVEVPLPAAPDEVLFEGAMTIGGIELVRSVSPPPLPEPPPATTAWRPADLAWEGPAATAVEKGADGSVRLAQTEAAPKTPLIATWNLPAPEFGPRELIVRLDDFTPGTGVVLGGPDGKQQIVCGFVAPTAGGPPDRQGNLFLTWSADKSPLTVGDPKNLGFAFAPRPVWMRFQVGDSMLTISWSGDGRHWARLRQYPKVWTAATGAAISSIGLFAGAHPGRSITLGEVAVAELPAFARLLPRDLLPAVNAGLVAVTDAKRGDDWVAATVKQKPEGVEENRWLAAAAIRCLAMGRTNLTARLCSIVWRHALAEDFSLADRLDVCDDLNRLSTSFGNGDAWVSTAPYCVLARECVDRGDVDGFRTTWLRLMQAPSDIHYLSEFHPQVDIIDTRRRLLRRLLVTDPGGALRSELARQLYYGQDEGLANGIANQFDTGGPVVFDADRPLSNVAREFAAAVALEDWPDAQRTVARYLAESGAAAASQLIRHPDDPDRMVTLLVLIAEALRDHPAYRDALQGDAADRGRLRIAWLRAAGDAEGMAVAALEFAGAPPAAEAEEWLATRALAAGDVAAAREHAVAGRAWADADTAGRLVSIEALAEALGSAGVRTKPQAGLPNAAAADIAAVVAQAPARNPVAEQLPKPGDLEATKRLDLDAAPSKEGYSSHASSICNPIDERVHVFITPYFFRQRLDWGAEVCSISAAPGRLLVTNRLELVSLDPATAAVQWRLPPGPKPGGLDSLGPGLVAMRPCWDDRHVYLRRLALGNAPTVAAVRLADGIVAWESPATAPHPISDPVLMDGGLTFFEVRPGLIDELVCVVLDPATGARKCERLVGNLQPKWRVRRAKYDDKNIDAGDCQVAVADGRLYATIGGCVLCCQSDGRLRWTRHLPWIAADVDGWWRYQAQAPPLVHDGKVFLMQPGFPGIAAVDAADGRLLWKQPLVLPRRLVGLAGAGDASRLVVETDDGILACDPRDGSMRMLLEARDGPGDFWLGIAPTRLVGSPLATADGQVVAMVQQRRADTAATNMLDVAVVWVDVATGAIQKTAEVPSLGGKPPWAGPLAVADGRLWTLAHAAYAADMRRALWELAPKPAP